MDESNAEAENGTDATQEQAANPAADAAGAPADVQAPEYEDLSAAPGGNVISHPSLDIVLDVPVTVSLEVGKAI